MIYETDNVEPIVLDRISRSYEKGRTLFGFFKTISGEAVTYNDKEIANRPFLRQDHDLAYVMFKYGLTTEGKKMNEATLNSIVSERAEVRRKKQEDQEREADAQGLAKRQAERQSNEESDAASKKKRKRDK